MKIETSMHALFALAMTTVAISACGDSGSNDTGNDTSGGPDDSTTAGPDDTTGGPGGPTDPDSSGGPGSSGEPESSGGPQESGDSTTGEGGEFMFADDPYEAYTQIDRHAAVEAGTAGIAGPEGLGFNPGSDITVRDAYNASNPVEDAAGMWLDEISDSVMFFHIALDDDIAAFGLTPATVNETLAQAGPVIVPDTIKYNPAQPTGYPNGRALEDQVVDITLAAVMLQLGPNQPLSLLADLPLNPPANDVPFKAVFPYLADPHPAP